ncbi:MAG: hypothetical protein ACK55I_35420, partial [bacterium]
MARATARAVARHALLFVCREARQLGRDHALPDVRLPHDLHGLVDAVGDAKDVEVAWAYRLELLEQCGLHPRNQWIPEVLAHQHHRERNDLQRLD